MIRIIKLDVYAGCGGSRKKWTRTESVKEK